MKYTEDTLIEQPAIKLYSELGWKTVSCWDDEFGEESLFGRNNRGDVVLPNRLRQALDQLNPDAPKLAIDEAIEALSRDRSAMSPIAANEDIYQLLREGYKYQASDDEDVTVRIIDWQNPENSDFLLCSQMSITGEIETRCSDLLSLVKGLSRKTLFKRKLYARYSHFRKRYFIRYGLRASDTLKSKAIRRQRKPLWRRLVEEIYK